MALRSVEMQWMLLHQINNTVPQNQISEDTFRLIYKQNGHIIDHSVNLDTILKTCSNSQHKIIEENSEIQTISAIYEKSELIYINRLKIIYGMGASVKSLMSKFWDLNSMASRIVWIKLNKPWHIFWAETWLKFV